MPAFTLLGKRRLTAAAVSPAAGVAGRWWKHHARGVSVPPLLRCLKVLSRLSSILSCLYTSPFRIYPFGSNPHIKKCKFCQNIEKIGKEFFWVGRGVWERMGIILKHLYLRICGCFWSCTGEGRFREWGMGVCVEQQILGAIRGLLVWRVNRFGGKWNLRFQLLNLGNIRVAPLWFRWLHFPPVNAWKKNGLSGWALIRWPLPFPCRKVRKAKHIVTPTPPLLERR